jgi:two-component system response regulator AtoC
MLRDDGKTSGEALVTFHGMVTASGAMQDFFSVVRRVAAEDLPVLIRGETGTGKELAARAIHDLSPRSGGPFRAINCATLTPELLASELFGHVKGAFTGAIRSRKGIFQLAHGGTLFLDEIAELPLDIQARLLRVLEERVFVPVGGTEPVKVDIRLVAATHRALRREVSEGRFRRDLMHRIRVIPLFLPPLRDRVGDIEALTWHFIREICEGRTRQLTAIEPACLSALERYPWPGNVRELRNVVQYALVMGSGDTLRLEHLTPELRGEPPPASGPEGDWDREERQRILDALRQAGGNRGAAAEALGLHRSTLWRKMKEYGL